MAPTMSLVSDPSSSRSNPTNKSSISHRPKPRLRWTASLLLLLVLVCRVAAHTADSPVPAETLIMDSRVPNMVQGKWVMVSQQEHKRRDLDGRAASSSDSSSAPSPATTTFQIAVSTVTMASTTSVAPASPLPSPLDGSISSNFSSTGTTPNACPAFLNSFLTNPTFKQCYPFSLLLQGSTSFFEAEKSLVSITQVLDASCSANVTFCANYMTSLAKNLTDASNCKRDYDLGNSVVVQSYVAMISYQTLYGATCLKDPGTAAYCYANAVTNLTTPSNVYIYYLPLNISLPGSSIPSCSWCLEKTMGIYQSAASNRALPVANTYVSSAQQVNTICGPGFVNSTLPNAAVSSRGHTSVIPWPQWMLVALPLFAALQWLL